MHASQDQLIISACNPSIHLLGFIHVAVIGCPTQLNHNQQLHISGCLGRSPSLIIGSLVNTHGNLAKVHQKKPCDHSSKINGCQTKRSRATDPRVAIERHTKDVFAITGSCIGVTFSLFICDLCINWVFNHPMITKR